MTSFADYGLSPSLQKALDQLGYSTPTAIQSKALPLALSGRDLIACAQTGSGKTAAFVLPYLQRLAGEARGNGARQTRCLVLVPTRELAIQVEASFRAYGQHVGVRAKSVYGGVGYGAQIAALRGGADIVVATPGRLLDLIGRGNARLDGVTYLVLDEADRMLDLGFLPQVRRVLSEGRIPKRGRQTLLFSATVSDEIAKLASEILTDPVRVHTASSPTVETIDQQLYPVAQGQKAALLARLMRHESVESALIFTRTRRRADRLSRDLRAAGLDNATIHAGVSQGRREKALMAFREGRIKFMVATDVAARGLDIPHISHVVNHDVPNVAEDYVHRIGRTGRAGRSGVAMTLYSRSDEALWEAVETLTDQPLPHSRLSDFRYEPDTSEPELTRRQRAVRNRNGNGSGKGRSGTRAGGRAKTGGGASASRSESRSSEAGSTKGGRARGGKPGGRSDGGKSGRGNGGNRRRSGGGGRRPR